MFALVLSFPLGAAAAEGVQVAEYRADVDDVSWSAGVDVDGLYPEDENAAYPAGERSIGPRHYFSPNSFAQLFYSLDEGNSDRPYAGLWEAESIARRTGLSQTWFFARRRARITLGYGFGQSETEAIYDDLRAHSVLFSSRFPLFLGLSARIQADYAHNSYDSYLGFNDVDSSRKLFQASIDQKFGNRLLGEIRFSYTDEDFDDTDLSYRRSVWGLNLQYKY